MTSIISTGILAFSKTQPMFILVAAIWGIGPAFLIPSLMAYALDRVDSSRRGPAVAILTAMLDLGISLGPVIMGFVVHLTDYPTMFLCLALIGAINLSYFNFIVRKKR
jgi:MFS family permease